MRKRITLSLLVFVFSSLAFVLLSSAMPVAQAQRPVPPNDYTRGLVYDGLEVANDGECKGGFKVQVRGNALSEAQCTHGPDPVPANFALAKPVPPPPTPSTPGSILCDGDGVKGKRVQVLYAHAADVPSRYATYLASFQQWAAEVDAAIQKSAAQTGDDRRVRFVTDANCKPVVTEVQFSGAGAMGFGDTIGDLSAQGFNRKDRKYMVFVDAHVYCGIGSVENDDSPGKGNKSNGGPHYSRIDAGCWSGVIAAHELMHNLGGVQMSAPHSDGNYHCIDGYDNMCDHGGSPSVQYTVCPDPTGDGLFDCNHDDYYSTNPPANSYLAKHWNVADNQFLIAPSTTSRSR